MKKGYIFTIILVIAPLIWLAISLNNIKVDYSDVSGEYVDMENLINTADEEYTNSHETTNTAATTNDSGETSSAGKYGTPLTKIIEGAKIKDTSAVVYSEPDETSQPNGSVYKENSLTIVDYPNGWSMITFENISGWIQTEKILKPEDQNNNTSIAGSAIGHNATVVIDTLNVRKSDSIKSDVVDQLNKDAEFKIIGANNDESWYEIQWGTHTGWIKADKNWINIKY